MLCKQSWNVRFRNSCAPSSLTSFDLPDQTQVSHILQKSGRHFAVRQLYISGMGKFGRQAVNPIHSNLNLPQLLCPFFLLLTKQSAFVTTTVKSHSNFKQYCETVKEKKNLRNLIFIPAFLNRDTRCKTNNKLVDKSVMQNFSSRINS